MFGVDFRDERGRCKQQAMCLRNHLDRRDISKALSLGRKSARDVVPGRVLSCLLDGRTRLPPVWVVATEGLGGGVALIVTCMAVVLRQSTLASLQS